MRAMNNATRMVLLATFIAAALAQNSAVYYHLQAGYEIRSHTQMIYIYEVNLFIIYGKHRQFKKYRMNDGQNKCFEGGGSVVEDPNSLNAKLLKKVLV